MVCEYFHNALKKKKSIFYFLNRSSSYYLEGSWEISHWPGRQAFERCNHCWERREHAPLPFLPVVFYVSGAAML